MGTRYSAVFYADEAVDLKALGAALFEAVDRVDRQMSTWKPDSHLNRLNAAPLGEWIAVPRELATVLAASLKIARSSAGSFDVGVGDLVAAGGFGPDRSKPDPERVKTLAAAPRLPAANFLELNEITLHARKQAHLSLDLSGIAKGYAVDEMARVMEDFEVRSILVGIDGEMRARGKKPDGTLWAVGLERPKQGVRDAMGVIELTDTAVATSGNYRRSATLGSKTVSHTIDPKTGAPLENDIVSVTVLASNCMEADAWATALMVLGEKAGPGMAKELGIDTIFVLQDGSTLSSI
jgi:thiamine biosynthesis lipoprotein